jgi:hypothetical protein
MPWAMFYGRGIHNLFWYLIRRPIDPISAKRVQATQQVAIHKIRTSGNHHWASPILDARPGGRRVPVVEVERKSGPHPDRSEESLFSRCEKSALNRLTLLRVRRIFDYHSRDGPHSLFRDTASAAADALQSVNATTTESGRVAWRSPQLRCD